MAFDVLFKAYPMGTSLTQIQSGRTVPLRLFCDLYCRRCDEDIHGHAGEVLGLLPPVTGSDLMNLVVIFVAT
jgi:hypothetical protein